MFILQYSSYVHLLIIIFNFYILMFKLIKIPDYCISATSSAIFVQDVFPLAVLPVTCCVLVTSAGCGYYFVIVVGAADR